MSASNWGSFSIRLTVAPGNSAFLVPLDSTRLMYELAWASIASGAAALAPGRLRGKYPTPKIAYTVRCTTQDVTYAEQVLTGNAGTSADWETQGTGTGTVTAGTTTVREFRPEAPDWRILISAGATGPATCIVMATATFTEDFGS